MAVVTLRAPCLAILPSPTWGKPGEHDLHMIKPILLHQCVKCSGIRW